MILQKNFIFNILNKNINKFNEFNILFFYILYLILIIILSTIFYSKFILLYPEIIDINGNINYKNLPFEYGVLTENLINNQKYFDKIIVMGETVNFYLSRLPVLPYLYYVSSFFSPKLFFLIIFKNIIFFSIIFFTTLNFTKYKNYNFFSFLTIILIFFYNPFNLKIITNFVYADFIISILIPILFLICISNFKYKDYYVGLIIFTLYLSKTSMMFVCIFITIYFLLIEKKKNSYLLSLDRNYFMGYIWLFKNKQIPFCSKYALY